MSEQRFRHAASPRDDTRTESRRADRSASDSGDDADADTADVDPSLDVQAQSARTNRWRPTIRQGIALWALIGVGWAVVPADHPVQIAVAVSGVYASFLLPTALYLDFRARRPESSARRAVRETASELVDRARDAHPGRDGASRSTCSCNR
ncbi:hypothetical protein [Haloferax sulfurifontis]|uniref:Uncharacterized protein n=1 Tax=Haloferax sulfurifontis ATCC BAA-897 TaxID=662480 RepID=M0IHF9_9EURY|nr:hypothetical protein [Haloferax sulfurifontis]ELZ96201.1 hypothetical protein C441_05149 [Haloferax sulfurifontis ATCC BAA-897]